VAFQYGLRMQVCGFPTWFKDAGLWSRARPAPLLQHLTRGMGFRFWSLGCGVSVLGFGVSGFGIRDSGFGIRDSGFGIRDSGTRELSTQSLIRSPVPCTSAENVYLILSLTVE